MAGYLLRGKSEFANVPFVPLKSSESSVLSDNHLIDCCQTEVSLTAV